jgi:transcriptional regulator with XRE-family HTH domain
MSKMSKMSETATKPADDKPVVQRAEPDQRIGKAEVASDARGAPFADLLHRVEAKYPGIEEKVGLSSAAMRAGQRIREMRLAKGWTQTQLAQKLGWDQERISNLERGEGTRGPTFDVLQKVSAACDYELKFSPRLEPERVAKPFVLKAFAQEPFNLADMVRQIGKAFVQAGVSHGKIQPNAAFAASCISFAKLFEHGVQAHATTVEGAESKKIADVGVGTIPYVELASHGTRMVTVPVLIEKIGKAPAAADAELEVTVTYPHPVKIG